MEPLEWPGGVTDGSSTPVSTNAWPWCRARDLKISHRKPPSHLQRVAKDRKTAVPQTKTRVTKGSYEVSPCPWTIMPGQKPTRLPPLKTLRVHQPKKAVENPCITIMSTVLGKEGRPPLSASQPFPCPDTLGSWWSNWEACIFGEGEKKEI